MARPEEGCSRKSRKSMPQVKGLKELMLPVWQQGNGSRGGLATDSVKEVPSGCRLLSSNHNCQVISMVVRGTGDADKRSV